MANDSIDKYVHEIFDLTASLARLPDDRQSLGFGKGQRFILYYLEKHPDGVSSGMLSTTLHVGTGRIGNALKELERKGFIRRRPDKADRRKVVVQITPEGHTFLSEGWKKFLRAIDVALQAVGKDRFEEFLRTYRDILLAQREALEKEETCSSSTEN